MSLEELKLLMEPSKYVGRSVHQCEKYLSEFVRPVLDANKEILGATSTINV